MDGPKKYPAGRILVITILAVGIIAAWSSRRYYTVRHPISLSARVNLNVVVAQFSPKAENVIRPGMMATVSINGTPHKGRVKGRDLMKDSTFIIILTSSIAPAPEAEVTVVVDTTVPPELLKDL
jgi:hypothetical protein